MNDEHTIEPGDLQHVLHWCRSHGDQVAALAAQGDAEAQWVIKAYRDGHKDPLNVEKQNELIRQVKTFIRRDLELGERKELAERFGYKVQQ